MKKLKKILLINWLYFSKQLIEVEDINFLTGKNGAGKSTVIDALQIVLLGETNSRNFNKAANDSSQRTLDGYLRADMDPNNPTSRKGKDFSSYIACEFWDDQKEKSFVAGIVFDCRSDGSRRDQYYIYDGTIPDTCFLVQRRAMDIPALRAYLKSMFGAHAQMYDSNKQYRADLLAKWNVHSEQVCRMLKKAVSFRPIVNIQQFITENICDIPDKPDIQAMQQNIRDYKQHEKLAERQEHKLSALKEISQQFIDLQNTITRLQQQRFLTLWAQKEVLEQQTQRLEQEKHDCEMDMQKEEVRRRELVDEIAHREARKNKLIAAREKSDIYQEQNRLQEQQRQLEQEQKRLEKQIAQTILETKQEAQALVALCDRVAHWLELESLGGIQKGAEALKNACLPLENCSAEIFSGTLSPFEKAQTVSAAFSDQLRKAAYEIENHKEKLESELRDIDATLEMLRKNIKDYPTGLLDLKHRIQTKLFEKYHQTVSVEVLADVLEIADGEEAWRGAVEGFLNTQKFYLLVEPAAYGEALSIYDGIKREYGRQSFGLVDVGKIREHEHSQPRDDSLAKKVDTKDPLARSYVDYLLGRVVCCAHSSQLRNHRTAITADGMLYQGYVARPIPKARMEDAFIGRKAVALRIQRLSENRQALLKECQQLQPVCDELGKQKKREFLFTGRFLQEVTMRQNDYLHGLEIKKDLEKVAEKLSKLDLFWLAGLDKQIKTLTNEIDALRQDQSASDRKSGELEGLLRILEYEKLPGHYQQLTEKKNAIQERYDAQYQETTGLPRYHQELARLKKASVVAKNFGDQCPRTENEVRQSQEKLFQLRRAYVQQFQSCHFRIEALDNSEPEYQYETAQVRDRFNQAAEELARAGFVQLEWVPGRPVLSKIILNLSNVQQAYQKAGRKHPREKAQHVCAILRQTLAGVHLPWIAAFRDETCAAIEHTWKIPALFRQGDAFLEDLMHAFKCYDGLCGGTITARAFSTQCFQNSKRFEREFQEPFLKIAAQFQSELAEISEHQTLSDKEMLALLGIYSHPELYPLSGRCSIVTTGGVIDLAPLFPNGVALPSTAVQSITSFSLKNIHQVTFIENKTNYEEYLFAELAADELAVFHGGFLSPQKQLFFKKMAEFIPDKTRIVFWADIDLGGFQMFSRLQQIFPQLQPVRMGAEDVDRYAQYGLHRDDSYLRRLQTAFETGEFPMFQNAIQKILRYRVTIEQEVFLADEIYRKRSQK